MCTLPIHGLIFPLTVHARYSLHFHCPWNCAQPKYRSKKKNCNGNCNGWIKRLAGPKPLTSDDCLLFEKDFNMQIYKLTLQCISVAGSPSTFTATKRCSSMSVSCIGMTSTYLSSTTFALCSPRPDMLDLNADVVWTAHSSH